MFAFTNNAAASLCICSVSKEDEFLQVLIAGATDFQHC